MAEKEKQKKKKPPQPWPTRVRRWMARLRDPAVSVPLSILMAVAAFCAVVGSIYLVVFTKEPEAYRGANPSAIAQQQAASALYGYEQTGEFAVPLEAVTSLAVVGDRTYVGGDQRILVLDPDGGFLSQIALDDTPRCIAVGAEDHAFPGRVYVGFTDHVAVFDPEGEQVYDWNVPNERTALTAIAVEMDTISVLDAARKVIYRYSPEGRLLGRSDERPDVPDADDTSLALPLQQTGVRI